MMKKIAVIGSGISGLAASWFLGEGHHVTLFERQITLGIGAHSVDVEGGRVDVPLRVLYPGYYPELFGLLSQCGVEVEALDASLSFSDADGQCYFRYRNQQLFGHVVPLLPMRMLLKAASREILFDLGRFMLNVPREYRQGRLSGRTIGSYLSQQKYSRAFIDGFLVPCFAGINTVSNDNVSHYPAELIAQYFTRGFVFSSVYRAIGGARAISDALSQRVAQTELGARIQSVRRTADGVVIRSESGIEAQFDAVVFATQANQVLPLMTDATDEERAILNSFRYGAVRVLMHRDERLAPCDRKAWAPVNYVLSDAHDRPMITIWVNALLPSYSSAVPMFQTINPHFEADPNLVVKQSDLERPIVDLTSDDWIQRLNALHAQPDRRVFFCGSYAASGIPLLESATVSAQRVAQCVADRRL